MAHLGTPSQTHASIPDRYWVSEDQIWAGKAKTDLKPSTSASPSPHFRRITPNPDYRPGRTTMTESSPGARSAQLDETTRLLFGPPRRDAVDALHGTAVSGDGLAAIAAANQSMEASGAYALSARRKGESAKSDEASQTQTLRTRIAGLEAQLHAKETLLSEEREKVLELRKAMDGLESQLDAAQADAETAQATQVAVEVRELQELVLELKTENAELERRLRASTRAVHSELNAQQAKHSSEVAALRSALETRSDASVDGESLLSHQAMAREASKEAIEAQMETKTLRLELAHVQSAMRELQDYNTQLERTLQSRENAIDDESATLSRLARHASATDARALSEQIRKLEAEKKALEHIIHSDRAMSGAASSSHLDRSMHSVAEPGSPGSSLAVQLENARSQNEHLAEQLQEYETENAELRALVAELQAHHGGSLFNDDSGDLLPAHLSTRADDTLGTQPDAHVVVKHAEPGSVTVVASPGSSIFRADRVAPDSGARAAGAPTPSPGARRGKTLARSTKLAPRSSTRPAGNRLVRRHHTSHLAPTPPASVYASRSRANWWPQRDVVESNASAKRMSKRAWKPPGPEPPGPNDPSIKLSPTK